MGWNSWFILDERNSVTATVKYKENKEAVMEDIKGTG